MHEPRCKAGLGMGYAISPTGADHCHNIRDTGYVMRIGSGPKAMGIVEPLPSQDLSAAKVRIQLYGSLWQHALNCLVFCQFVPMASDRMADLINGITGWNTNLWEMLKAGERTANLMRLFNLREGFTGRDDRLPSLFFENISHIPQATTF